MRARPAAAAAAGPPAERHDVGGRPCMHNVFPALWRAAHPAAPAAGTTTRCCSIHPGTAWGWLTATEGVGCTLGAFLEQLGVAARAPDGLRYRAHGAGCSRRPPQRHLRRRRGAAGVRRRRRRRAALHADLDAGAVRGEPPRWCATAAAACGACTCAGRAVDGGGRRAAAAAGAGVRAAAAAHRRGSAGRDRLWLGVADRTWSRSATRPPTGRAPTPTCWCRARRRCSALRRMVPVGFDGGVYPLAEHFDGGAATAGGA
jgi:hypothetical protein